MKAIGLLQRKMQLLDRKKEIFGQLEQAKADMSQKDMELFIESGSMTQLNSKEVAILEKEREHLARLELGLNKEISRTRKSERLKKVSKLNHKIQGFEEKRTGSLHDKYLHLLERIENLKEIDRGIRAEIITLKALLVETNQRSTELVFRLPGLEQVLKENYFAHPDELEAMVEEAYRDNEKCLKAGLGSRIPDYLIRGFQLVLDVDSGEILKRKETSCDKDMTKRNPAIMSEVKK